MNGKSWKVLETEKFVDEYIIKYGYPPTYKIIEKQFNLSACAAWNRCGKFRDKMKLYDVPKKEGGRWVRIRIDLMVPHSKVSAFSALVATMENLIKS